ncbi:MAG: hypothetical protein ACRDKU_02965, partial [Gaiellaceae bacterium]
MGVLAAALVVASSAGAAQVRVVIDDQVQPAFARRAVGLLVPGRGPTVSREEALEALEGIDPS